MTVWYDLTTSSTAKGRNGIAKTETMLGLHLANLDPSMRTFVHQPGRGLVVLDEPDLHRMLNSSVDTQGRPEPIERSVIGNVRRALIGALGDEALPLIQVVGAARGTTRRMRARLAGVTFARRSQRPRLRDCVRSGEVVVTMGADWSGATLDELARIKADRQCRVIAMAFDLIPLTHTHLAFNKNRDIFERYYRKLISTADLVLCISASSLADLRAFAQSQALELPRCEVLHLGDAESDCDSAAEFDRVRRRDLVLWVGTVERRKNLELLFDALRILESEGTQLPTVAVVGERGWGVRDLLKEIELESTAASRSFVFLGNVPDATLASLYRRASALVFPSHYEGWGLPLREAAIHGCPIAAGDTPASREALLAYSGATFLPTDDPGKWADYLASPRKPADPVEPRTWEAAARQFHAIASASSASASRPSGR
jgi:glycosyltransferase involved in cell wall biosynthesis